MNPKLENKIACYNEEVFSHFPFLEKQYHTTDAVVLPSMCKDTSQSVALKQWARAELFIRVGIGHDLLQELRMAAGLHSYFMRRQKHSRGRTQMEKVSKSQAAASRKKNAIVTSYSRNWEKISHIFSINSELNLIRDELLKGLQVLNKTEDVKFFEEWGVQTENYMGFTPLNVSWIWRIAMDGISQKFQVDRGQVKQLTDSWESEGKYYTLI
jgi:hypothetical protein